MKINYLIPIVLIIGFGALFFFPNPENNILAYFGTALFFIILIVFLIGWGRKKK